MRKVYQKQLGSIRKVKRASGADVWEWRYRVRGKMKQQMFPVADYPTKLSLWNHLETAIKNLNAGEPEPMPVAVTMGAVIDKYRIKYFPDLAKSTRDTDGSMLKVHIEPRWAKVLVAAVYAEDVEDWIKTLTSEEGKPLSPASKGRARRLMKQLMDKAMFWRFIPHTENPIKLVKVKGSSTREKKPVISPMEHVNALILALDSPYNLMVLVAASLGLRVSEVVSLYWEDLNWEKKTVIVRRAYTHGAMGKVKSKASWAELPIEDELREELLSFHTGGSELVFPSPVTGHCYSADTILAKKIKPALEMLGLPKIGWHTFRHSLKSRAGSGQATLTQQKDMMRHASIPIGDMYGGTPLEELRPLMAAASKGLVRLRPRPGPSTPGCAGG